MNHRNYNSNIQGAGFGPQIVEEVWSHAHKEGGKFYDAYDNQIKREEYGNVNSQYGWEIDHKNPVSNGGTDNVSRNLRPLQWRENRNKGDTYPYPKQRVWYD